LAASLEQQIQDLRQQKENLDHIVAEQHTAWEKEKERRIREEREFTESLNVRRQQEEQAYQKAWAAEQEKARQRLDEELRVIQLEKQDVRSAIETSLQERELLFKKKELEWGQLIQELEQFLYKLERRQRLHDTIHAVWPNGIAGEQPIQVSSESVPSGNTHEEHVFYVAEEDELAGSDPASGSIRGNEVEDDGASNDSSASIFGKDWEEEPRHSTLAKKDTAPLKFSPKRSAGSKPEA